MASKLKKGDPIRAVLARSENPYAFAEYEELHDEIDPAQARRDYVRSLQNPYASLALTEDTAIEIVAPKGVPAAKPVGKCSKSEFKSRCRFIFGGYMPALEKGKLRDHHRDFIHRNESKSPEVRYNLLAHLAKYDLSAHLGLSGRFNRERDVFTEEKLHKIERAVEDVSE